MNDSKNEAGFRIEVSRISLPHLYGGVMMDHEYDAVSRIRQTEVCPFLIWGGAMND